MKQAKFTIGLCILICLSASLAYGNIQTDKREVVRQAKQSYYSLSKLGFSSLQAKVQPTWEVAVKGVESNPQALRLLNSLKFSMSLGLDGNVKVNHEATIPAPNAQAEAGFKQIFDGIDQALSGFFATWNIFMLNSPLPAVGSEYQLDELGGQYVLTYKDGSAEVTTRMNRDFNITEIKLSSPDFKSSVRPQFTKTAKGNVLTGYLASYVPTSGPGKAELDIHIDYLEVNGLQLPHKLHLNSTYDSQPAEMELIFSDYQVTTR